MLLYIARRFVIALVTLFVIITATWFMMQFLPGSPFNTTGKLTPAAQAKLMEKYGLDEPLLVQYTTYVANMVRGDLGTSLYFRGTPITEILLNRAPVSAFLGLQSLVLGLIVGLPLGIIAALRHNRTADSSATVVAVLGVSIPNFVLAALLQYWVGLKWGLLPIAYWESYAHTILPSLALSVFVIAVVARFIRTEMLEVLSQDYITLAESKGLGRVAVVVKHALRNAITPVVAVILPLVVSIVTGSIVVEQIFSVPGIGQEFVRSIVVKDYQMILGTTILYSTIFVLARLVQDVLYGIIDPRIRVAGQKE